MPRQARIDSPGLLHHVINRGNERRKIFLQRSDYATFKDALAELVKEGGFTCYAWVLMPNHFHLLVETGPRPLSELMNRLSTRYAGYFNRRHKRTGRLFQNRYKSIVCEKDPYFKELVAYLHLNPLRAKMVDSLESLESYPWSGHRAILGLEKASWQAVDPVLEIFGSKPGPDQRNYLNYLAEKKGVKQDLSGGGLIRSAGGLDVVMRRGRGDREAFDSRVLGSGDFVEKVLPHEDAARLHRQDPLVIARVIKGVEDFFGLPEKGLSRPGKSTRVGASARAVAAFLLVEKCGLRKVEVAEKMRITQPAISELYTRGSSKSNEIETICQSVGIV